MSNSYELFDAIVGDPKAGSDFDDSKSHSALVVSVVVDTFAQPSISLKARPSSQSLRMLKSCPKPEHLSDLCAR